MDPALSKALREVRPRWSIPFHGGFIPEYFHAARMLTRQGIPYIFTPRGSYNTVALRKSAWMKKLYFPLFERFVLNHAAPFICWATAKSLPCSGCIQKRGTTSSPMGKTNQF